MRTIRTWPRADWAQLSSELWATIFLLLQPDPQDDKEEEYYDFHRELHEFYELSKVCRKFHSLCMQQRSLRSCLFLRDDLDGDALPGMYHWIQRYANSVQTVFAYPGSPYIEAALASLQAHRQPTHATNMTTMHLSKSAANQTLPESVLVLVAQFTTLTTCTLDMYTYGFAPVGPEFPLHAFQSMQHLVKLTLANGIFRCLEAASYLTHLFISSSEVKCDEDCACVTSLLELDLTHSALRWFHAQGVRACSRLQVLHCSHSYMLVRNGAEDMKFHRNEPIKIPNSLSALTSLTRLGFSYAHSTAEIDVGWLSQLQSLHCICATLNVPSAAFPDSLSVLTHLTRLSIANDTARGLFSFLWDWTLFSQLQVLSLYCTLRVEQVFH